MEPGFNSQNTTNPEINSIEQWISHFKKGYALGDNNQSDSLADGLLRNSTGNQLVIRKITSKMLIDDTDLAEKIHKLALAGQLGFASTDKSQILFRQDVANTLKIGNIKTIMVIKANNTTKQLNATIASVDNASYSSLAGLAPSVPEAKPDPTEKKQKEKGSRLVERLANSVPAVPLSKISMGTNKIIAKLCVSIGQQLRKNERKRHERAVEQQQKDAEEERQAVKDYTLKQEIRKAARNTQEINTSQQDR